MEHLRLGLMGSVDSVDRWEARFPGGNFSITPVADPEHHALSLVGSTPQCQ